MSTFSTAPNFSWEKDFSIVRLPKLPNEPPTQAVKAVSAPFKRPEREAFATSMTFTDLWHLGHNVINYDLLYKHRWKYNHALYSILSSPEFSFIQLETCLERNSSYIVSKEHLIMTITHSYPFKNTAAIEKAIHLLYSTYDLERTNAVDWRDILLGYKFLLNFKLLREQTVELFLTLCDIYNENTQTESHKVDKDELVLVNYMEIVKKVMFLVCRIDTEMTMTAARLDAFFLKMKEEHKDRQVIKRRTLRRLLIAYGAKGLEIWRKYGWERLSSAQRLTILDNSTLYHKDQAEIIIGRYKLGQALHMYMSNTLKKVFIEWKLVTIRDTGARIFIYRKNLKKQHIAMKFWLYFSRRRSVRRKRRLLADVMGSYALKARCFERIKLFNANTRRAEKVVGSLHKKARIFALAGTYLRNYDRLHSLKTYYHRWWNECVVQNNLEVADEHSRLRILKRVFRPWFDHAHEEQQQMKQDMMARENKIVLDRRLEDQEEAVAELLRLEKEREERIRKAQEEQEQKERQQKLEEYKAKVKMEKYTEKRLLLNVQRDDRSKRIEEETKKLMKKFRKGWVDKEKEMYAKAKERIAVFVSNKENEAALEMKFLTLKREFYAYPTPETKEKERALASYRNIMFLYMEHYLKTNDKTVQDIITQYDSHNKGFINFSEFTKFIRTLNTCLNEAQISSGIRSTDTSRNKEVSASEIQQGLDRIQGRLGVLGSPWKIYIDPTEDVICYHNFTSNEKVLEYKMTDIILKRIVVDDMYGFAEYQTAFDIKEQKRVEWEKIMKDYMARRIQYMYKYWKGKTYRKKKVWKITKRIQREITRNQRIVAKFLQKRYVGRKIRKQFLKQYFLTIEKVYDINSGKEFYYNHYTKQSTWTKPLLLKRYNADVTPAALWLPIDPADDSTAMALAQAADESTATNLLLGYEEERTKEHQETANSMNLVPILSAAPSSDSSLVPSTPSAPSFYHVQAKRTIPFKPDGYPLCNMCQFNLAVHTCKQCNVQEVGDGRLTGGMFCFPCHRATHAHPLGFFQRTKATKHQYAQDQFIERYHNFKHDWIDTAPYRCELCKQTKLNAAHLCQTCGMKKMCRQCFQRIHVHKAYHHHYHYNI